MPRFPQLSSWRSLSSSGSGERLLRLQFNEGMSLWPLHTLRVLCPRSCNRNRGAWMDSGDFAHREAMYRGGGERTSKYILKANTARHTHPPPKKKEEKRKCRSIVECLPRIARPWWLAPVIPAVGKWRQENQEFKADWAIKTSLKKNHPHTYVAYK